MAASRFKKFWFIPVLFALTSCNAQKPWTKEQLAVKKIIDNEQLFFVQGKLEQWAALWVHEPLTFWSTSHADFRYYHAGWDSFYNWIAPLLKKNNSTQTTLSPRTYDIHVYGSGAFARFVVKDSTQTVYETRVLEKRKGTWKIIFHQAYHVPAGIQKP